ncbi:hypothetical protein, partial [Barnesiella intestinihominis]|uniref:hypothetical protein n=1 Tax=Barnesiella intestinihominis TaxID=487174 RepID=UPI003AB142B0
LFKKQLQSTRLQMRNNAAYLPENPIVYIIFPESIHNRASFTIFVKSFENENSIHNLEKR